MRKFGLALILVTLPLVCAAAPIPVTLTFDELGNGIFDSPVLGPTFSPGFLFFDPGPGGLCCVLTYDLLGPPSLVAGDVILVEPGKGSTVSDLIRFNPDGTGGMCGCYPASLLFYSDDLGGVTSVADTGFPTAQYTNVVTL